MKKSYHSNRAPAKLPATTLRIARGSRPEGAGVVSTMSITPLASYIDGWPALLDPSAGSASRIQCLDHRCRVVLPMAGS